MTTTYDSIQAKIIKLCRQQEAIQAVLLIGSRARTDRPPDPHADLDLLLFISDPQQFTTLPSWLETVSDLWLSVFGRTGHGDPEWILLYTGGHKVDYVFTPIGREQPLTEALETTPYPFVLARGFQVLLDKTASQGSLSYPSIQDSTPSLPTAAEFTAAIDQTLIIALRAMKYIPRGDLWRAKMLCDSLLKEQLLTMIEWHARATHGPQHDTWYSGRYLPEWADPQAVAALPATFATYDPADLRRALQQTLTLYHRLASETAAHLTLSYPTPGQQATLTWLKS